MMFRWCFTKTDVSYGGSCYVEKTSRTKLGGHSVSNTGIYFGIETSAAAKSICLEQSATSRVPFPFRGYLRTWSESLLYIYLSVPSTATARHVFLFAYMTGEGMKYEYSYWTGGIETV